MQSPAGVHYSVWNPARAEFDYYVAPGQIPDGIFAPTPKVKGRHKLGATPLEAARNLPAGSRKVGGGAMPIGMVASKGSQPAGLGVFGVEGRTLSKVLVIAAVSVTVWQFLRPATKARIKGVFK